MAQLSCLASLACLGRFDSGDQVLSDLEFVGSALTEGLEVRECCVGIGQSVSKPTRVTEEESDVKTPAPGTEEIARLRMASWWCLSARSVSISP